MTTTLAEAEAVPSRYPDFRPCDEAGIGGCPFTISWESLIAQS